MTTDWTAEDGAVLARDYKGDGEYIIYDLGSIYSLDLIQFNTENKSDSYGIQIWVSTTGTQVSDFSMVLPTSGDLLLTATNTTDFNQYEVDTDARYVKLLGYGRFNSTGDTRTSAWNAITEIEFYGSSSTLSVDEVDLQSSIVLYPIPAKNILHIKNLNNLINSMRVYSLVGRKIIEKEIRSSSLELDTSLISNGTYIINFNNGSNINYSRRLIISH